MADATDTTTEKPADKPKATRTRGTTRKAAEPAETPEQVAEREAKEAKKREAKRIADLKTQLYSDETKALRAKYKTEFEDGVARRYAEHGLTYKRRLTDEEKEQEQLRALIAKHPELAAATVNAVNPSAPAGGGAVPSNTDDGWTEAEVDAARQAVAEFNSDPV